MITEEAYYQDWADSPEDGCRSCGAPYEYCDCLTCAECGEVVATEGAWQYARLTPATVCCSPERKEPKIILTPGGHGRVEPCTRRFASPPSR